MLSLVISIQRLRLSSYQFEPNRFINVQIHATPDGQTRLITYIYMLFIWIKKPLEGVEICTVAAISTRFSIISDVQWVGSAWPTHWGSSWLISNICNPAFTSSSKWKSVTANTTQIKQKRCYFKQDCTAYDRHHLFIKSARCSHCSTWVRFTHRLASAGLGLPSSPRSQAARSHTGHHDAVWSPLYQSPSILLLTAAARPRHRPPDHCPRDLTTDEKRLSLISNGWSYHENLWRSDWHHLIDQSVRLSPFLTCSQVKHENVTYFC